MNTKLLKRYRKDALRNVKCDAVDERKIFIKKYRTGEYLHKNLSFFAWLDYRLYWESDFFQTNVIEEAKNVLKVARRVYIMELVREERERRLREKVINL